MAEIKETVALPPTALVGKETYRQFHDRLVSDYFSKGYKKSNLPEINQRRFCIGAGCTDIDPNEIIQ